MTPAVIAMVAIPATVVVVAFGRDDAHKIVNLLGILITTVVALAVSAY
jgi:hypothetical protein